MGKHVFVFTEFLICFLFSFQQLVDPYTLPSVWIFYFPSTETPGSQDQSL